MPSSMSQRPGLGLLTLDHLVPFQCKIKVRHDLHVPFWAPIV
jgi:hypothetical protein